ncbi:MAG: protein kinase [Thermoanaerobaculia bacterium]
MTLAAGARLGPYEVLSALGAGGMGEVYRARDTRLERTVAVKVLPTHLSSSPEVRQRFDREARTISQLSHPHICALYDVGHQDGVDYLVMEYLEGETLADRLTARGALPVEQMLRYGVQMADALDKAHRQGIVHRDLKPGNVMLTKSGVKLLDFGLAKALAPVSTQSSLTAFPTQAPDLTAEGTLLGTLSYMAPEQLEGKEADARTDIFAFGCVLYEMATGRKAFSGTSQASLIGSILRDEPQPISQVQPMTPPTLDRVVKTCLAKDRDDRWQTAHDVKLQMQWIAEGGSAAGLPAPAVARRKSRERLAWGLVALLSVALAAALAFGVRRRQVEPPRTVRAFIPPPANSAFLFAGEANPGPVTVSPDGRRLAFTAADPDGGTQLWVHPLDALEAFPIPRTEDAYFPFWSPDSRFLGFFANGKLKTVEASDSPAPPRALADVFEGRGGSWSGDGTILYSPGPRAPLHRVSSSGGKPAAVTRLDEKGGEVTHRWPLFLPDGRRFLYSARLAERARGGIYAGSLDSDEKTFVLDADGNMAFASGHLLFLRGGRLLAAPFDPRTLAIAGQPLPVAERVEHFPPTGGSIFSASGSLLAYSPQGEGRLSRLVWLDRTGQELGTVGPPGTYPNARLSPDGTRVALSLMDPRYSTAPKLWIYETTRGTGTQLTYGVGVDLWPVWSPDGGRLVFSSSRKAQWDLYEKGLRERDEERLLLESGNNKFPNGFSRDGRFLLYEEFNSRTNRDIKVLPLDGDRRPRAFVATPFEERNAQFSPDGNRGGLCLRRAGEARGLSRRLPGSHSKTGLDGRRIAAGVERGRPGAFLHRDGKEARGGLRGDSRRRGGARAVPHSLPGASARARRDGVRRPAQVRRVARRPVSRPCTGCRGSPCADHPRPQLDGGVEEVDVSSCPTGQ